MYDQSFFVTSVRGSGAEPTTAASCALGVIGFMKAALGVRFVADFFLPELFLAELFFAVDFFADFEDDFFAELFFLVAIASPGG
jgi:hypothetical protein